MQEEKQDGTFAHVEAMRHPEANEAMRRSTLAFVNFNDLFKIRTSLVHLCLNDCIKNPDVWGSSTLGEEMLELITFLDRLTRESLLGTELVKEDIPKDFHEQMAKLKQIKQEMV